jgi:hypothetical protein
MFFLVPLSCPLIFFFFLFVCDFTSPVSMMFVYRLQKLQVLIENSVGFGLA